MPAFSRLPPSPADLDVPRADSRGTRHGDMGMKLFVAIPLTVLPLLAFNLVVFGLAGGEGGDPWLSPVFTAQLVSGAEFALTLGDAVVVAGLFALFIEILKATRVGIASLADHILSTLVLIAYLVEFLSIRQAATSVFFILMVVAFIDVVAGFSITITGSRRDVAFGGDDFRR